MEMRFFRFFPIFILIVSCQHESSMQNSFSSSTDTLQIITTKIKGTGVFQPRSISLRTKDTSNLFLGEITYPIGIDRVKRVELSVDFVVSTYYSYKKGQDNLLKYVNEDIKYNYIDTASCLPQNETLLNIIEGSVDGSRVLIIDENNNKDLSDDSIRKVEEIEWDNPNDFVGFTFPIFNGSEIVHEKSWLGFRINDEDDMIYWGKKEHIIAEFRIDEKAFTIDIGRPFAYDFVYDYDDMHPYMLQFKLLTEEEDTYDFLKSNYLQLGQYVKLGDQYYYIQNISRDGKELTLVKEDDFPSKIGTQVGLMAPEFNCIAQNGDTVRSIDLKDKGIIIANMCGCGGDYESVQAYNDILSELGEEYHVLGVDSQFFSETRGILINSDNPFNEEFYKNYRQMYCSRSTFVIDKDFRIETRLVTTDWQSYF